jgi:hypothetical protein
MYFNGSYDGQSSLLQALLMWEVTVLGMTCLCSVVEYVISETDYDSHNFMENVIFILKIKVVCKLDSSATYSSWC